MKTRCHPDRPRHSRRLDGSARRRLTAPCLALWLALLVAQAPLAQAAELVVNPAHPAASDSGPGGESAPFKTITYAMSLLQPGDRLVIAEGVYREVMVFPQRRWELAETTIEGRGRVVVKGSDVVGQWTPLGGGRFVKPWPSETEQVHVDGAPLQQIGGTVFDGFPDDAQHPMHALNRGQGGIWPGRKKGDQDSMPVGSFYYDAGEKNLYIRVVGPELGARMVEVSTRSGALFGENLANVTLRDLDFEHGNTSWKRRAGLVTLLGDRLTLERINVVRADSIGMILIGNDITLRDSSANDCGQVGIMGRGQRMRLINNETSRNNTRGFNRWWEAGGAKFVGGGGLQDSVVSGHRALNNTGDGLWFDWMNRNNRIEHSFIAYNSGMGLHYEASVGGIIIDNVVIGNGGRGIYLPQSSQSAVAYNLVAGNGLQGIVVIDEGRRDPAGKYKLKPAGNKVFGNVVAWNQGAIYLPLEPAENHSDGNLFIGNSSQTKFSLGWTRLSKKDLTEWVSTTGNDRRSEYIDHAMDVAFRLSIAERRRKPNLTWYKIVRAGAKPPEIDPAWARLVPDADSRRPGPAP